MMMTRQPASYWLKFTTPIFLSALLSGCATTEKPVAALSIPKPLPAIQNNAANEALKLQGHPYVFGGESPTEGFDCSGLVYYIYQKQGVKLPRDTSSLVSQLPSVQLDQRQPGDLLFFSLDTKPLSHVGIYVGHDKFVHAPSARTGRVMLSDLNQPYWRDRFAAVRRPHSFSGRPLSQNTAIQNLCLAE